ncbi:hypothetical protein ACFV0B_09180 [Streptomyces xanthophaeus]|uniref:hypothetical protein n=1 Tax=Streptomyces xanthophaeus TaxID=67385 RepID=UPI0036CD85CC
MSIGELSASPVLNVPELEPVPMPGCLICRAAGRRREAIRPLGNGVSIHNSNDIIRQHPHRRTTDSKGAA